MGNQNQKRIVVTGLGVVSPVGIGVKETWQGLLNGKLGIDRISRFDPSELRVQIAGEVKEFEPADYMDYKEARRLDRYIQFAVAAAKEAYEDAGLATSGLDHDRIGVFVTTGVGGVGTLLENREIAEEKGYRRVSPFLITNILPDSAAGKVAIELGLRGPNHAVVSACASGTAAVGEAFELLRRGQADAVLAGGAEAAINPLIVAGFDNMGALSRNNEDPQHACKPFDLNRDGFVMSEGAAVCVLETEERAQARGAKIYAEVIGYGSAADADNMAAPQADAVGAIIAMDMALKTAAAYGVNPEEIDYINAHGTGTHLNDATESMAIKKTFGEHAYSLKISGLKGMTGHLLGAAGALEAVVTSLILDTGQAPATVNLVDRDPECDLDYLPGSAVALEPLVAMSNSFGFGGHNASIILRKYVA